MVHGVNKSKGPFDEYIGKYVVIYPSAQTNFQGKIMSIEEGYAVLNPHVGVVYKNGIGLRKLIDNPSKIRMLDIIGIQPATKKNLEAYCKSFNEETKKQQESK